MTNPQGGQQPSTAPLPGAPPPDLPPPPPGAPNRHAFIPYLGPEPTPSKPFGAGLTVAAALVALVSAALAVKYWLRRNLWLADPSAGATTASIERLNANAALTGPLLGARHILVPIALLAGVLWWVSRRMPTVPALKGPGYVERPLLRSMPAWLWVLPPLLGVLGTALTMAANAGLSEPTWSFADAVKLNEHRAELNTLASLGSLARMGAWALVALWPVCAGRSHRERLDRSRPYRPPTAF